MDDSLAIQIEGVLDFGYIQRWAFESFYLLRKTRIKKKNSHSGAQA